MNLGAVLLTGLFAGGISCAAVQGGLLTGLVTRMRAGYPPSGEAGQPRHGGGPAQAKRSTVVPSASRTGSPGRGNAHAAQRDHAPDAEFTPSPARIAIFLDEAAASKMRVTLRPILNEKTHLTSKSWRGTIKPANRDKWFASYQAFLLPYATAAQAHGAAGLVVGTELDSLQTDRRWNALIPQVRAVFTGTLGYSQDYESYQDYMGTPAVYRIGVDAYPRGWLPDTATPAQLRAIWEQWITKYAGGQAETLVLDEVGIAAQNGAYTNPASRGSANVNVNLDVQNNWYHAICEAAASTKIRGIYFWNIRLHANPGYEDPQQADRLTFVDRPAQEAIRDCYARLGARPSLDPRRLIE